MTAEDIAIPILPCRSIQDTIRFYRSIGFSGDAHLADPNYAILKLGTLELHFFHHPTLKPHESHAGCYLRVSDVDRIHGAFKAAELPAHGIPRLTAPEQKPWRMREFALVDADGNLLRVGQPV